MEGREKKKKKRSLALFLSRWIEKKDWSEMVILQAPKKKCCVCGWSYPGDIVSSLALPLGEKREKHSVWQRKELSEWGTSANGGKG